MSFGAVAASYLAVIGDPSQRVALGFGAGSGAVVTDSSGNGNTFTMSSAGAWAATGHTGAGLDGTVGYAYGTFGGGASWNEWTIMCWVRRTSDTDCAIWGSTDSQIVLSIQNGGSAGRLDLWSAQQSDGVI